MLIFGTLQFLQFQEPKEEFRIDHLTEILRSNVSDWHFHNIIHHQSQKYIVGTPLFPSWIPTKEQEADNK